MPGVNPVAESEVDVVLVVRTTAAPPPTGVKVAIYPLIVAPPVLVGAVTSIAAAVVEGLAALVIVGALGATAGWVTELEVAAVPGPTWLVATAV